MATDSRVLDATQQNDPSPQILTDDAPPAAIAMTGGTTDILVALAIIFIPLTLFSALLLGIVFQRRIQYLPPSSSLSTLDDSELYSTNAYYVRISSTTVVLLASFSSSIAPTLVSFFMVLFSYPISRRILKISDGRKLSDLPTPFQLGLLITTLSGSLGALWHWVKYLLRWKKQRKIGSSLKLSVLGLLLTTVFM